MGPVPWARARSQGPGPMVPWSHGPGPMGPGPGPRALRTYKEGPIYTFYVVIYQLFDEIIPFLLNSCIFQKHVKTLGEKCVKHMPNLEGTCENQSICHFNEFKIYPGQF